MLLDHVIVEHSRGILPNSKRTRLHSVIDGLHVARAEHVSRNNNNMQVSKPGFFISNNLVNGNR